MIIYIALLRGINVGGKNIIKMTELKQVFEKLGLNEVKTYIQSGNVLFKSNEGEETLRKKIENEIESAFGFHVQVVLRTLKELERIISACPFSVEHISEVESMSDSESMYVSLMTDAPPEDKITLLDAYRSESEEYEVAGREVYLLFSNSIRNSKLANNLHRLDVPTTVRNWKTINKLASLAKAMEN